MEIVTSRLRMQMLDQGRGSPLVLLHPFPFSNEAWEGNADALAAHARLIAPSLRGFGGTEPFDSATPPSIDAMADDVASLLDALDLREPITLGGLSMGGYVALSFARRHAARLGALILADTRAEPDDEEAKKNRDRTIVRVDAGEWPDVASGSLERLLGTKTRSDRPDVVARARAMMLSAPPRAVVDASIALRDRPDARPALGAIRVPTLVLVGAEDVVTPPSAAEVIANAIAGAKLVVIPRAGHLSNLEDPAAFQAAVEDFATEISTRRARSNGSR